MSKRLEGKVAVITGAGSGIGQATAEKFVKEGAKVALCDINKEHLQETVKMLKGMGGEAEAYEVDVTNVGQIRKARDEIVAKWGRLEALLNIAGIIKDAQLVKMTEADFDAVINVNLKGTYNMARELVDQMVKQGSGVILNTSSVVGVYGNFGQTNYAATKFGVVGMAKTWCKELAKKGIRANAICPGFVLTPMVKSMPQDVLDKLAAKIPARRLAEPEEIANLFAFLASDEAKYINGAAIEITGGLTL